MKAKVTSKKERKQDNIRILMENTARKQNRVQFEEAMEGKKILARERKEKRKKIQYTSKKGIMKINKRSIKEQ